MSKFSGGELAVVGVIGFLMIAIGLGIGYLISVGIIWLIFTAFNITGYNIWLMGLVWMIVVQVLKSIFGSKN